MKLCFVLLLTVGALDAAVFESKLRHVRHLKSPAMNRKHLEMKNTASRPIHECDRGVYTIETFVGTPPQKFLAILTVETNEGLWVVGRNCTSKECNGLSTSEYPKNHFDERKSETYKDLNKDFVYHYTGDVSGHVGSDTVQVNGFIAQNCEVAVANNFGEAVRFGYFKMDAMLGLGLPATCITKILDQLDQSVFTIWLRDEEYADGVLTLGGVDRAHCDSAIRWLPVASDDDWHFKISGFSMGNYTVKKEQIALSALDSWLLGGPSEYVQKMAALAGATLDYTYGMYMVPCTAQMTAPDIIFNIGGIGYIIPANEYIEDLQLDDGKCAFAFGYTDKMANLDWFLGSRFIRKFCHSYDVVNKRIGFSKAK